AAHLQGACTVSWLASLAATFNRLAANPGGAAVRGRRRQSASLAARPSARGTTRACGTPACTSRDWPHVRLKVAACGLLALDGLEQRLEVALAEALAPFPLDDLEEQRRAVGDGAGEDLQQIAVVVSIDEDAQVAKAVQVLVDALGALPDRVVVRIGRVEELDATVPHGGHGADD